MKKVKKSKILLIILLLFYILTVLNRPVYATTSISDIFTKADDFVKKGQTSSTGTTIDDDSLQNMSDIIYNTLLIIGVVVAVIVGMVLAIKLMTGSIEEQAKVKQTLVAYIAGCIVVFGAFAIWKLVVTVLQSSPTA